MGLLDVSDGYLGCLPNVLSTLAHFTLCPLSLMNLSYEHDYMSPTSPNKLLDLVGALLETLGTRRMATIT